jgi:hypothetical protein
VTPCAEFCFRSCKVFSVRLFSVRVDMRVSPWGSVAFGLPFLLDSAPDEGRRRSAVAERTVCAVGEDFAGWWGDRA